MLTVEYALCLSARTPINCAGVKVSEPYAKFARSNSYFEILLITFCSVSLQQMLLEKL